MPYNINKPAGTDQANTIDNSVIDNQTAIDTALAALTNGVAQAGAIIIQFIRAVNTAIFKTRVSGDSQERFQLLSQGEMQWGSGGASLDVILKRGAADVLELGDGDAMRSGTNNRFLMKQSMVRAAKTAAQSILNNTATMVTFDAADSFDTDGLHDPASNNTRLTAQFAGQYLVVGHVVWAANTVGGRDLRLIKNGATEYALVRDGAADDAGDKRQPICDLVDLGAGGYVELRALQTSGGALNIASASLAMVYLGS